jgi:D-erythritol 1-phosphate dehydrogenase
MKELGALDVIDAAWTHRPAGGKFMAASGYARIFGTRANDLLQAARSLADLGRHFGGGLAHFLIAKEWATTAEDILMRGTKHGPHMSAAERQAFAAWLDGAA